MKTKLVIFLVHKKDDFTTCEFQIRETKPLAFPSQSAKVRHAFKNKNFDFIENIHALSRHR